MDNMLDDKTHFSIAKKISQNMKRRRLDLNFTQEELSEKSGVSLGSLKRFEAISEISLKNLLQLAIALTATEAFHELFVVEKPERIDDILKQNRTIQRKRARSNG